MSMALCGICGDLVDTDAHPEACIDDSFVCVSCLETYYYPCDACGELVDKQRASFRRSEPHEKGSDGWDAMILCPGCARGG
jgi:hypothetical protein